MKKTLKIFSWIIISIVAIYSIVIIIEKLIWKDRTPSIFGVKNYIVLSGSMEPTIGVGDIVFIKDTDNIKEQDIIAFRVNNSVVTHRVIEIIDDTGEKKYKTKGDANSAEDEELLKAEDIEGKYIFRIPKIGNVILFLKTKTGIIILGIILIISMFISGNKKGEENTK